MDSKGNSDYYLKTRAIYFTEQTDEEKRERIQRCHNEEKRKNVKSQSKDKEESSNERLPVKSSQVVRDHAIQHMYNVLGGPPEDKWKEEGVIKKILHQLFIPDNSYRTVLRVLNETVRCRNNDEEFDPLAKRKASCGAKRAIEDNDSSARVIYEAVETGLNNTMITFLVNKHRKAIDPDGGQFPPVGRTTVENFIRRSNVIVTTVREGTKQGSNDEKSDWAQGRLVFASQLKEELRLGTLPPDCEEVLNSDFKPLHLEALVEFDEKHLKQQIGCHSKNERRVKRDADGNPDPDGELPAKKQKVNLKYENEARALMGCYITEIDGKREGIPTPTFDYTGRKVVGFKAYRAAVLAELQAKSSRVKNKKESCWTRGVGGYEGRYGDRYMEEAEKVVNKTLCSSKELIDFMHQTTIDAYRGSKYEGRERVYHDHLSAMWEDEAVQYMKDIGFFQKLIFIRGPNNANVVKRYRDSLPGNSPEHARGTDSHCFSDLMRIVCANVALTSHYENDDPRKFTLATPKSCMSAMLRAWSIVPSHRFLDDIMDWPKIIDKIIEAKGTKVEGVALRSGKRYLKQGSETEYYKSKPKNRDRIATLDGTPIHDDAKEGLDRILGLDSKAYDEFLEMHELLEAMLDLQGDEGVTDKEEVADSKDDMDDDE